MRGRITSRVMSWPVLLGALFTAGAAGVAVVTENKLDYAVGQRIDHPIYAHVSFQVPNPKQTETNRKAARASTPSYYKWNAFGVTFDRIRADLSRLYRIAADAATFEDYSTQARELLAEAPDESGYAYLRRLTGQPDDAGRATFQKWVADLPLETEYLVRNLREPRDPPSNADYIVVEREEPDGSRTMVNVRHASVLRQENERALGGIAEDLAKKSFPFDLRNTVQQIILATLREQPTIIYNADRTTEEMRKAEAATPEAFITHEKGRPFITPCVLGSEQLELLRAHHAAYETFLRGESPDAEQLRLERMLQRVGLGTLVGFLALTLLVYARMNQRRIFENRLELAEYGALLLSALASAVLIDIYWPHIPELIFVPGLFAASIAAIVYPRRFAIGTICILAVLISTAVRGNLVFLLTLITGVAATTYQLEEIRSRTKLITAGTVTAVVMVIVSVAGGLVEAHSWAYLRERAQWAALAAFAAAFVVSGLLPFIERIFRVATALTLLEWRDPTRTLLQLLAREAPGTYNHSLVLGTLAQAACERIAANGLLAQVGALYHDIGKIPKAEYFTENQEGRTNLHDRLAPTMSLLIILAHVKDGLEMAREYKLPHVLHQFIAEHHGTTVVRYFHHLASEKQPKIASGRHDRAVSEAEFRYSGPKPRTRESAVVMMCDGVEGAVRSLSDPTVGRIESTVHQVISDRLADGQFDDCDITLKEIRLVEESLVKSLCGIYHGRVAYPKARKPVEEAPEPARMSV